MEPDASTIGPETSAHGATSDLASRISIPDHQLVRRIGQGSYGEVWLARNMMGTYRAVKIVSRKSFKHQRPFERELSGIQKFEPISRSHEGFMDILHVGINEEEGYFYYVMELGDDQVSGQNIDPANYAPKTLAREISVQGKLPFPACLQLGLGLSDALAELHRHGLVHRDIKPSNIIFVNGVAKLADIGLVAGVDEARSYVGTEGFIPPEGPGTPQADVYSLGKVLYEVSTGKDRQDFPELPTRLEQLSDAEGFLELNEVILHACKNEPDRRYRTAREMHADLQVLASGKSVRRLRMLERRLANLKRVMGILALVLAACAGVSYPLYFNWKHAFESRQRQVGANVAYGNRAVEGGDLSAALPYFAEALRLDKGDPAREAPHRLRFSSVHAQCPRIVQMLFHTGQVDNVEFSPDGEQILAVGKFRQTQIFDAHTGKAVSPLLGQDDFLRGAAYNAEGTLVATASNDRTACIWRASDGANVRRLEHPELVFSVNFSPDGRRLITGCQDNWARVWDVNTGQLEFTLKAHTNAVLFAAFSHDGRRIVTASRDSTARIWDAMTGKSIGPPLIHPSWVGYAGFSPDDRILVTASLDHKARLWEVDTGRRIPPDLNHSDGVKSAEFSPDGQLILTACLDHTARIWEADSHRPVSSNPILWHSDRVMRAAFSSNGHRILTGCADGTVRLWDLAGGAVAPQPVRRIFSGDRSRFASLTQGELQVRDTISGQVVSPLIHAGPLVQEPSQVSLNSDGRFILTSFTPPEGSNAWQRVVEIWETETGEQIGQPLPLSNIWQQLVLNKSGTCLLAFGGNIARAWSVVNGTELSPEVKHGANIQGAVFNGSRNTVATWAGDEVKVWDAMSGKELFPPLKHANPVKYVEFSPDGTRLVICSADDTFAKCQAQVWHAATGRPLSPPLKHDDGVLHASFSPDSRCVVTASEDFTAKIWSAAAGIQLAPALRHEEGQVQAAAFSPDGQWIVTASSDKTARVWSADTGEPLTPPLRHLANLAEARFLSDSRHVITVDVPGKACLWELPLDQRPVEDLIRLSRLLSGDAIAPSGWPNPVQIESQEALWRWLHSRYPSDFATSREEIAAWYEFQAEQSEAQQQWYAAAFHLKRLLALHPNDPSLDQRLARAASNIAPAPAIKLPEISH